MSLFDPMPPKIEAESDRFEIPPPPPQPDLERRLLNGHRLWVDPHTAAYVAGRLGAGAARIGFIAADARTGCCGFHDLRASELSDERPGRAAREGGGDGASGDA